MALIKQKVTSSGATGSYWKIVHTSQDKKSMRGAWTIALFENKEHADKLYPALLTKSFSKICTKEEFASNFIHTGYEYIKSKNDRDLLNAVDE